MSIQNEIQNRLLWQVADQFKYWVLTELQNLSAKERESFLGFFSFIIDDFPMFIVFVDLQDVRCVSILKNSEGVFEPQDPKAFDGIEITSSLHDIIYFGARAIVRTSSSVLEKLLYGKLKAKLAFLTGKVIVEGDLPSFLKMVSMLKQRGVSAPGSGH